MQCTSIHTHMNTQNYTQTQLAAVLDALQLKIYLLNIKEKRKETKKII